MKVTIQRKASRELVEQAIREYRLIDTTDFTEKLVPMQVGDQWWIGYEGPDPRGGETAGDVWSEELAALALEFLWTLEKLDDQQSRVTPSAADDADRANDCARDEMHMPQYEIPRRFA